MPTLRWFGRRCVTSWPSMLDRAVGRRLEAGDHAQGRGLAAAARARGRRRTRRARSADRNAARRCWRRRTCAGSTISRNMSFPRPSSAVSRGARRLPAEELDEAHAGPGDGESDDRERRRLIGAVGADELQVRPEGRPVEQARHGELADHDGEGEKRAAEDRDADVRQDDLEQDRRPARAEILRRLGQGADVDGPQARVDGAVHVGQREGRHSRRSAGGWCRASVSVSGSQDDELYIRR